jgi:hypothetical protein
MKPSEALARQYLLGLNLGPIVFEPDGQIPPDFVIGGRIAVEVRRLNQHHDTPDGPKGLESLEAALARFVEVLLPRFGPAPGGQGWWVSFSFRRPLDGKTIKRALPRALEAFRTDPAQEGLSLQLAPTFTLEIRPASIPVEHYFMLGSYIDRDAGGFVLGEIIRNLKLCIAEKTAKIAPYAHRYPQWWLALLDHIGPDLNAGERAMIGDYIDTGFFDRIILIHPRALERSLVLSR